MSEYDEDELAEIRAGAGKIMRFEMLRFILLEEPYLQDGEVTPLEFFEEAIKELLAMRPPDPLTEDWRPLREFPRYAINRCGEVKNLETNFVLKNSWKDSYGRKVSDLKKVQRQNLTVDMIVHGRSTDQLLREAFSDITD